MKLRGKRALLALAALAIAAGGVTIAALPAGAAPKVPTFVTTTVTGPDTTLPPLLGTNNGIGTATASCPAGFAVTGGGYTAGLSGTDASTMVIHSGPTADGWEVTAQNRTSNPLPLTAVVVCGQLQ